VVKVKVPATTANMGAGFDVFGLALDLYNYVELTETDYGIIIENEGALAAKLAGLAKPEYNLVNRSAQALFSVVGYKPKGLTWVLANNIPFSRGLGSSAAGIVGGLLAANAISGNYLNKEELLKLALEMEKHPDNVAPALYGGFVISCRKEDSPPSVVRLLPPAALKVVVAIPDFYLSTKISREVLPKEVSLKDAVCNVQNAALLVVAMCKGDLTLLNQAMEDKLHQPYRFPLVKGGKEVLAAAKEAGALSVSLSGSGPALVAYTDGDGKAIGEAMVQAWQKFNVEAKAITLKPDLTGAAVVA